MPKKYHELTDGYQSGIDPDQILAARIAQQYDFDTPDRKRRGTPPNGANPAAEFALWMIQKDPNMRIALAQFYGVEPPESVEFSIPMQVARDPALGAEVSNG